MELSQRFNSAIINIMYFSPKCYSLIVDPEGDENKVMLGVGVGSHAKKFISPETAHESHSDEYKRIHALMVEILNSKDYGILGWVEAIGKKLEMPTDDFTTMMHRTYTMVACETNVFIRNEINTVGFHINVVDKSVGSDKCKYGYTIGLHNRGLPDIITATDTCSRNLFVGVVYELVNKWRENGITYGRVSGILVDFDLYVEDPTGKILPFQDKPFGIPKVYEEYEGLDNLDREKYPELIRIYFPDSNNKFSFEEGYSTGDENIAYGED